MTQVLHSELSVSFDDSRVFARLSGDYNPLHIDPVVARRTRFGGTATHGIHLFLRALDELAAQRLFDNQRPTTLFVSFDNPVLTGTTVSLRIDVDAGRVRLSGESSGRAVLNGTIELAPASECQPQLEDADYPPSSPADVNFPPAINSSTVPLRLSRSLLAQLFPSLRSLPCTCWIADLLATTHVVGMHCPGMHSIYSGFRLRWGQTRHLPATTMRYSVAGTEKRFQLLKMEVAGSALQGTVQTFFRPRPVMQLSMTEVAAIVSPRVFSGQRVLVVGGSRGLGELTTKIVAAGGASVTLTYALGRGDAERICAEVRAHGAACEIQQMDVAAVGSKETADWLASGRFSHVYFYASTLITKNPGRWNPSLFRQYAQIYVGGFADLVELVLATREQQDIPVHFLYPSSVFVAQPEAGFAEYAVAKAAGEALCDQLQGRRGASFSKPRLPRMRTDQTSSLGSGAADPLPVMLDVVRNFQA